MTPELEKRLKAVSGVILNVTLRDGEYDYQRGVEKIMQYLRPEFERLAKDAERLDWLDDCCFSFKDAKDGELVDSHIPLRDAIDKAREGGE